MNETGTAARTWMNPTESAQRAETQIRRPSFRLISGLENTAEPYDLADPAWLSLLGFKVLQLEK
jgi:hypothetical protein